MGLDRRFVLGGVIALAAIFACTAPMGPQGEQGPPGPGGGGLVDGGCAGGRMMCGSVCADLQTDPANCGACGVVCTDACVAGGCCGDGKVNGQEQCDKTPPPNSSCATAVAPGWMGSVACSMDCKLDTKGCTSPTSAWNDFTNGSNWSTFNVTSVNGGARGFQGGTFDGRYIYAVPSYNGGYDGLVARYDTMGTFASGAAWSVFDIASINGNARGYHHAAFDGRYVYFVPSYNGNPNQQGFVARYDTTGGFGSASAWSIFDLTTLWPGAKGYAGAVFDGRYLYFVPYNNGAIYSGQVVRYDTQQGFGYSGAWSSFDVTTLNASARGFQGGTFDGRYVYFAPYNNGNGSGTIARYDTQGGFGAMGSWATFDITTVNAAAKGYEGAVFDGQYVYLVPYHNGSAYHGLVARYDTKGAFDQMMSWSTFDISGVNGSAKGYIGGAFDGRYVYFSPHYNGGTYHGLVARFDSQAMFGATPSWSTFDTTSINGNARGYLGAVFDGRYLYLFQYYNPAIPNVDGNVARLDAKMPGWLPKGWNSSFY